MTGRAPLVLTNTSNQRLYSALFSATKLAKNVIKKQKRRPEPYKITIDDFWQNYSFTSYVEVDFRSNSFHTQMNIDSR